MSSGLGHAILAVLAEKPQSGYDIARRMKAPFGFLWQAKHGQIYPELARLVSLGLVDFQGLDQQDGPPRRIHRITPKGRAELVRWALERPAPRPLNDEMVIKAFVLRRVPPQRLAGIFEQELTTHENRLGTLEQLADGIRRRYGQADVGPDSQAFGEYAALRHAIGMEREYISWYRWLMTKLPARARRPPSIRTTRKPGRPRAGSKA